MMARTRQLLHEVLSGVTLLHQAGYVHGSLKPGNIIVVPTNIENKKDNDDNTTTTNNNGSTDIMMVDENTPVHVKLIDFGWTREAVAGEDSRVIIRYPGTAKFAPPETRNQAVLYRVQPQSVEIWTIAASFYFSITGELVPVDVISHQADVSHIESNALRALLSRMLHEDPARRVTAAEALKDAYFL
jgi:serine/threonine protein kinase